MSLSPRERVLTAVNHEQPDRTPQQIQTEVERCCHTLGHRSGYVLGPTHLFQPDIPPENILAVYA